MNLFTVKLLFSITLIFFIVHYFELHERTLAAPLKIMPLGDSITNGLGDTIHNETGYRYFLNQRLKKVDIEWDFVGIEKSAEFRIDGDHEGHNGWTIETLNDNIEKIVMSSKPDVILLLIGTNNALSKDTTSTVSLERFKTLITNIKKIDGKTKIFVGSLPPILKKSENRFIYSRLNEQKIKPFNEALHTTIQLLNEIYTDIYFVDIYSSLSDITVDFSDELHPSSQGYSKIADAWFLSFAEHNIIFDTTQIQAIKTKHFYNEFKEYDTTHFTNSILKFLLLQQFKNHLNFSPINLAGWQTGTIY